MLICMTLPLSPAMAQGLNVQINFENDVFYDRDYHYSNGMQIRFIAPEKYEFALGQHIYTPKKKKAEELQKDDRPYAGYLHASLAGRRLQQGRLDTLELSLGVIGPASLAESTQNGFHKFLDVRKAKGWDNQIENEPTAMLTLARVWRLNHAATEKGGLGWDILPRLAFSLGTPYTQAATSFEARLGWNLPDDYSSTVMRPGSGVFVPGNKNFSFFLFSRVEARALAWNSFLDGNIWRDSHSVDKFPCVVELSAGALAAYKDLRLAYTHNYRSKEFHGQKKAQIYGSVMVGYVF